MRHSYVQCTKWSTTGTMMRRNSARVFPDAQNRKKMVESRWKPLKRRLSAPIFLLLVVMVTLWTSTKYLDHLQVYRSPQPGSADPKVTFSHWHQGVNGLAEKISKMVQTQMQIGCWVCRHFGGRNHNFSWWTPLFLPQNKRITDPQRLLVGSMLLKLCSRKRWVSLRFLKNGLVKMGKSEL